MSQAYEQLKGRLQNNQYTWLITGVAGFIGSNLLEALLKLNQKVIGLDNFMTGYEKNLDEVKRLVAPQKWERFRFIRGDICDPGACQNVCQDVDYVLHQAALGSVPRSIENPVLTNKVNVEGFLNMLVSSRDSRVKRFVYASSSAVYGDEPALPKKEDKIGKPLSPYAVSKYTNELYAQNFAAIYGMEVVGLRYFNVFGPRQDPGGAYAAVIPRWIAAMIQNKPVIVYGDGTTSRDFCYIENVVQANLLAALTDNKQALNQVYNVACGERTDLNGLFEMLRAGLVKDYSHLEGLKPEYQDFRKGDVLHSLADISKAKRFLGYEPSHGVREGLGEAMRWYRENSGRP